MKKLLVIVALVAGAWFLLKRGASTAAPQKSVRPTTAGAIPKSVPDWFAATTKAIGLFNQPTNRASEPPIWNWTTDQAIDQYGDVTDAVNQNDDIDALGENFYNQ